MTGGGRAAGPAGDPFAALGLPARADVTDDDVRAAWRRIAAATHPDRDDGGDPVRFAAAAAAYATLRTPFGRGETLADLAETAAGPGWRRWTAPLARRIGGAAAALPGRRRRLAGRPASAGQVASAGQPARRALRLAVRLLAAAALGAFAFAAAGWSPGTVAVLAGAATWLAFTLRRERP